MSCRRKPGVRIPGKPYRHRLLPSFTMDCRLWTALFVRRIRGSAHVQVAQIAQHRSVFFTHAARKVRIAQVLIPRRLRHVLQHTQTLLNCSPAIRRHLAPFRHHFVTHVILLLPRHLSPDSSTIEHFLPLRRGEVSKPVVVLDDLPFFFRAQVPKSLLRARWLSVCRRWPVGINVGPGTSLRAI